MTDLNFIQSQDYSKNQAEKPKYPGLFRLFAVFGLSFIFIFSILNFSAIMGRVDVGSLFRDDEAIENERLTAELRFVYGYLATGTNGVVAGQPIFTQNRIQNQSGNSNGLNTNPQSADASVLYGSNQDETNTLSIPKIGVDAPILRSQTTDEGQIIKDLRKGVVMYPGSNTPGSNGTTVIIGHSSSGYPITKYSSVFAGLNKLEQGDLIFVYFNGIKYTYRVNRKIIGSVQDLTNLGITDELIVGTCWPIGTANERILVTASRLGL